MGLRGRARAPCGAGGAPGVAPACGVLWVRWASPCERAAGTHAWVAAASRRAHRGPIATQAPYEAPGPAAPPKLSSGGGEAGAAQASQPGAAQPPADAPPPNPLVVPPPAPPGGAAGDRVSSFQVEPGTPMGAARGDSGGAGALARRKRTAASRVKAKQQAARAAAQGWADEGGSPPGWPGLPASNRVAPAP